MGVREIYEQVGRTTGEGMGETSKVCRALLRVLANDLSEREVWLLLKRYRTPVVASAGYQGTRRKAPRARVQVY